MRRLRYLTLTVAILLVAFVAVAKPPEVPKELWYLEQPYIKEAIEKGLFLTDGEGRLRPSPQLLGEEDAVVLPENFEPPPLPEEIEELRLRAIEALRPTPEDVMVQAMEAGVHPADVTETEGAAKIYRFGQTATVHCAPKLACSIDLEVGETIRGRVIGDPDRWDYEELVSGTGARERWHILVRPSDYDIESNLIVTTDRRAYRIRLISAEFPTDPNNEVVEYTEAIAFRYPDEWVERKEPEPAREECVPAAGAPAAGAPAADSRSTPRASGTVVGTMAPPPLDLGPVPRLEVSGPPPVREAPASPASASTDARAPTAQAPTAVEPIPVEAIPEPGYGLGTELHELELPAPERLNFNYRIIQPRRKRHRFDWEPLAVMDDGVRTYIHLPPLSEMDITPVVSGIGPTGEPFPLNAILRDDVYIVPRLIRRAELYLGVGKRRLWLRIERIEEDSR